MTAPLSTSSGGQGEFRFDIDAAERAIRALEDVRRQIEEARAEAATLAKIEPTARDAVSLEAFALLAQQADGGPGSFTAAMDAGRVHVEQLIAQLRVDIVQQRALDDAAATDAAVDDA